MATQEKLQKSLEALKNLSNSNLFSDQSRKKEKIQYCYIVTEAFSNPTIKVSTNVQVLLGITIETFLKLCDDPESNVRMTSDECLNKIIRAVSDEHIGKIQIELHKEIKKNGSARSLRAALVRFSQLAHHIRPHKGKPYVVNLFPSMIKIASRDEELIHETLSGCLPKIVKVLGCFAPDGDIKMLLKAFLPNISKPSPAVRRSASNCILAICMHSRRPYVFMTYVINNLLDMAIPVDDCNNTSETLGILHCLKTLLPFLKITSSANDGFGYSKDIEIIQPVPTNKFLQIYEYCLYYLTNQDHNIVNASLETLNVYVSNMTDDVKRKLISTSGIDKSRIHKNLLVNHVRSPSQLSDVVNIASPEETLFSDCDLTETIESDIEKWIGESKLSVINMPHSSLSIKADSTETTTSTSEVNLDTNYENDNIREDPENFSMDMRSTSTDHNLDKFNDTSSEGSGVPSGNEDKPLVTDLDVQEIDIGDYLDKQPSIIYCVRLIIKSFLLHGVPGKFISDKNVRVSVKSSALTCLSSIFQIYPQGFFKYLDKNCLATIKLPSKTSSQRISDIMLFAEHSDPQLRGALRCIVSNLISSILTESNLDYNLWINNLKANEIDVVADGKYSDIEDFIEVITKGLKDDNSNCLKQTLLSLNPTLHLLAESSSCFAILPILNVLPVISNSPYWLAKVALCELVSKISYTTIYHITGDSQFQNKILDNIIFQFLKDTDQRIRTSASSSLVEIIRNLYFEEYHPKESPTTTKAIHMNKLLKFVNDSFKVNLHRTHFINNMPFPYSEIGSNNCDRVDYSLSKIVMKLYTALLPSDSKYFLHGCIEALSQLSSYYPCTIYQKAWCDYKHIKHEDVNLTMVNSTEDLFTLCINLLNTSVHVYDIAFIINIMNLAANLYAGHTMLLIKPIDISETTNQTWSMFPSSSFKPLSDQYLMHTIKLLNIFHSIINDLVPVTPQSKTVLPHLPSSGTLSPIKRRKSEDKKTAVIPGRIVMEKEDKAEKKESLKAVHMGCFAGSQHYMKLYEILRNAFINYKTSLDPKDSENFLDLMRKTLQTLCIILEVTTLNEFGHISEEVLTYLRSTFTLDPALTVQCVQQLLKCLFGSNLAANVGDILNGSRKKKESENYSFYYNIFQKHCEEMAICINSLKSINKIDCDGDSTVMGYLHRKEAKKPSGIIRTSDKTLANYIRIFEPMVIKSLKQYTVTSDVKLQCRVLQLLSQLVQLRINYCLLDSDQVFKDFVLKQFEYIEEGQVPHSEELTPKIFQFFVHLSKQHTKSIISIPKIIQLCDGLMASGQDPKTHCIPALEPIVEDVFLLRNRLNTTDMKELETTREVILAMLCRLMEYKEVIDLATLILEDSKYCTEDTDKWFRLSDQVVKAFLPMLKQNKIRIENVETFASLRKFIFALNPNVFKPTENLIVMLFQSPPSVDEKKILNRWISKVILLLLILSPLKEDILISKINKAKAEFSPGCIFEHFTPTADPLNVFNNADTFRNILGEDIIARMIFRVISVISKEVLETSRSSSDDFLVSQFSVFLMYCSHMFQSGNLCKVSQLAASLLTKGSLDIDIDVINQRFLLIGRCYPTVTFQWCHILSVLNYGNIKFWEKIIIDQKNSCINDSIVNVGSTIVFCDYLNENISETKQLSWNLTENCENLLNLIDEMPVSEFITFIHRNATLSKVIVQSITQKLLNNHDPIFKVRLLKCLENCHSSQIGAIIKLLIPRMLINKQVTLSRMVVSLASRKVEYLFTLPIDEVNTQLSKDDLSVIKEELKMMKLAKKYETLISLFDKLLVQYYDISPLELNRIHKINPHHIKKLQINKKWYLSQVQEKYHDGKLRNETAKIMQKIDYDELITIMKNENFNKLILRDCVRLGIDMLRDTDLKEEPPILRASVDCILREVSSIINEICVNHEVFNVEQQHNSYTQQILRSFKNEKFVTLLVNLNHSLSIIIKYLFYFPTLQLSEIDTENISKFAVLSLEYIKFIVCSNEGLKINYIDAFLTSTNEILKQHHFSNYLGLDNNLSWLCSAIDATHNFVAHLLKNEEPLSCIEKSSLRMTEENPDIRGAAEACHALYSLVYWLYKNQNGHAKIPNFLFHPIKSLVVSLSRLPLVNSYNLVPSRIWKLGWQPELTGKFCTQVPPLPIDMLQEIDILEEYIFRITLLGWTTRQQFEETWMALLSVLCTPLDTVDSVDINNALHTASLAIKAITSLLLQTMAYPVMGNMNVSKMLYVSRNESISNNTTSMKKLQVVQNHIQFKFKELSIQYSDMEIRNVFNNKNFEKISRQYAYGQMSIRYFMISTNPWVQKDNSPAEMVYQRRTNLLEECGLDVNSCLQFLLDYYTQLLKLESAVTNLRILHETVRSIVFISDLFTDKAQFSWMLDMFLDLLKIHAVEDELLHQYLIIGICKAVGVLTPDLEIYEQTKKLLVQFLKSPFIPSRISCLYGLLYILEGCFLSNVTIGGISEELQIILPCAVEYVQQNLNTNNPTLKKSQEHAMLVWSLAFYLIENVHEVHMETNFVESTLQAAFAAAHNKTGCSCIQKAIIKNLERLLLLRSMVVLEKFSKNIQKLALEKMKDDNPTVSILGVQLLISYMYIDCWEHLEKLEPDSEQSSPDHLVQTIEKLSALFESIKKSYEVEVKLLCSILPIILRDFFLPSDILTKVIGEFLSSQQPHPKLMSGVVFQVFETAIEQCQLPLLQDWVVFSLSNFTQSFSNMATWCLTCFFISASPNEWLRSFFPYVQARVGRYEYEDKKIFCIAGSDFYRNLTNDKQRQAFVDNFVKVKDQPDMPFNDLLNSL